MFNEKSSFHPSNITGWTPGFRNTSSDPKFIDWNTSPTLKSLEDWLHKNSYHKGGDDYGGIFAGKIPVKNGIMSTPNYYNGRANYNKLVTTSSQPSEFKQVCWDHKPRCSPMVGYGTPTTLPNTKAFDMPTVMYNLISQANRTVDIISLSPMADGPFQNAIQAGLIQIAKRKAKVLVRMFYGMAIQMVFHGSRKHILRNLVNYYHQILILRLW